MFPHEPEHFAAGIPLQALVAELRSRCEAASRFQGGSTGYHEELGIFRAYAEEAGILLAEPPPELNRPPDEEGNEHQVWYLAADKLVLSDTHRGNIILMDDGLLAPIDLRVQALSGSLLDTVTRLCEKAEG
jgi:hypothetical protein